MDEPRSIASGAAAPDRRSLKEAEAKAAELLVEAAAIDASLDKPKRGKVKKEKFRAEDATVEGKKQVPLPVMLLVLTIVIVVLVIVSLAVGRFHVDIPTTVKILLSPFLGGETGVDWTQNQYTVIMNLRLPRAIAAMLVQNVGCVLDNW